MTNESPDRLIRVSKEFLDQLGSRTADGYAIHAEWGEPDEDGIYEPRLTVDYTDRLNVIEHAPDLGDD